MKNKLLTVILIVLVAVTLVAVVVVALLWNFNKGEEGPKEPTIDEIVEASVDVPEITTNLKNRQFIKISLKIQTTSAEAAEELTKREFQVQNIVINELSEVDSQDLEGKAGKQKLQETLKVLINDKMQAGDVEQVYIVSYIIQ